MAWDHLSITKPHLVYIILGGFTSLFMLSSSVIKERIAAILKAEGYIADFRVDDAGFGSIVVTLKYGRDRQSAIVGLRRKSRPGRRVYVSYRDIPKVHNGLGVAIMSTSRGVMSDRTAREQKVGGEILCEVW